MAGTRKDKMALVAFMQAGNTSVYAGSWRHPATEHRYLDASYYAKIGRQLEEDPELGPTIIETLKMQGIQQFGDYAIQIVMKLKTRPGEQFAVRRRSLSLIKESFDANGVKFAFPTVNVAGGSNVSGAGAAAVLERASAIEHAAESKI